MSKKDLVIKKSDLICCSFFLLVKKKIKITQSHAQKHVFEFSRPKQAILIYNFNYIAQNLVFNKKPKNIRINNDNM